MRLKHFVSIKLRYLIIALIVLALFLMIENVAQFLQKPNMVDVEAEQDFLLKTSWHQIDEYARFVTLDDDAGCWATAIAQIAHYHRLNPTGTINYSTSSGDQVLVNLDDYLFNHDHFVRFIDDETPEISKQQVAKYIYYIAALIHTNFGDSGYLEHETMISRLEQHLKCSVEFYEYKKADFMDDQSKIRKLIIQEINAKRPLMFYFDNAKDFGHAAVLDGYTRTNGKFLVHLNQGMGGRHDGWYDPFDRIFGVRDDLQTRFLITFQVGEKNIDSH